MRQPDIAYSSRSSVGIVNMEILGFNRRVACAPFERRSVETKINAGFATVTQKLALTELTVIFGDGATINPGDVVYVKGDQAKHAWASEVYEIDGRSVILVPIESIQLVKHA